jgi:hypothetical protein
MHSLFLFLLLAGPGPTAEQKVVSSKGLGEVCVVGTKRRGVELSFRFELWHGAAVKVATVTAEDHDPRAVFAVCADLAGHTGDVVKEFVTSSDAPKLNALVLHSRAAREAPPGDDVEI